MKSIRSLFFACLILVFFEFNCFAVPVSYTDYTFNGIVSEMTLNTQMPFSSYEIGDPYKVELTYVYDPDIESEVSGLPYNIYEISHPGALVITVKDLILSFDFYSVIIGNYSDFDSISFCFHGGESNIGGNCEGGSLNLNDSSGSAISSKDLLPTLNPNSFDSIKSGFELSMEMGLYGCEISSGDMHIAAVPEPASMFLFGSGIALLLGFRKNRK